jgi:hypothetical protein
MKKIFTTLAFFSLTTFISAQNVGIGTPTPNASAKLEITDANRGILIPRIALTATNAATPVTAPATSLLVYNTVTAGVTPNNVTPGYYYWDGVKWVRLLNAESNDWKLLGNAGTNPATNFVGTTDNQDLVFRTNNTEKFRMTTAGAIQASQYGSAAAPAYTFINDPNTGLFHNPTLVDDIGLSTNGLIRLWVSDAGETYVGATAPVLPGDLFCATSTNATATTSGSGSLTWAVNGYTAYNGGSIYGLRLAGATGTWGSVQGETTASNPASSPGINGTVSAASHIGVRGYHPVGSGWGGIFYNDLGYTGSLLLASDKSLKKNILAYNGALSVISQIPIYSYEYKADEYDILGEKGELHYGVMAEELKQLLPNLVKTKTLGGLACRSCPNEIRDIEKNIEMVNYLELVPITIQAIKEQQILIKSQQEQIDILKKEIESIKK